VIVQQTLPDDLLGRAFGVKDALASWAFGVAFFAAGGLLTVVEPRELIIGTGVGGLLMAAACAIALRREATLDTDSEGLRDLRGRGRALPDV
jgi:hypothetical protein